MSTDLDKMVAELTTRVADVLRISKRAMGPNENMHECLDSIVTELSTLHSEEARAVENVRTAERRLCGIRGRESEISAFLERMRRVCSECVQE